MATNLDKPLISLNGIEWREHGYGLWAVVVSVCVNKKKVLKNMPILGLE